MRKIIFSAVMTLIVISAEARYRYEVFPLFTTEQFESTDVTGLTVYLSGHDILMGLAKEAGMPGLEDQLLSIKIKDVQYNAETASYMMHFDLLDSDEAVVYTASKELDKGSDGWLYLVGGK